MFNITKPKNKQPQYKVIVLPTKTHQVTNSSLEYAPKGTILIGQGENEKCKFVELGGNAKIDENGNFMLIYNSENNTLDSLNLPKDAFGNFLQKNDNKVTN